MIILKQSTAGQVVILGYFLDSTDGNTEETGLTIANTDIKIWKSGATTLADKNSGGATHISNALYHTTLDATDTSTLGPMNIFVHVAGALAVKLECLVVTAAAYDVMTAATGDAYARLGAPAGASISADVAAVKSQTAAIETDTQDIQSRIPAALVSGRIDASVGAMAANTLTASALATDAAEEIADAVWDEPLTGGAHNVATSAGRRLRQLADLSVLSEGTAQAGASEGITLEAGASFDAGTIKINYITLTGGTGAGQTRIITSYNNTTKIARIHRVWSVTPDNTSTYLIQANANIEVMDIGAVQGAAATTITLNGAAPTDDDVLIGATIAILNGTGRDQQRIITDYNGTTKVATIKQAWDVTPTTSSDYAIFPYGRAIVVDANSGGGGAIADEILNRNLAGGGSGNTRNIRNSLRALRNRQAIAAGTLTVYAEDDATPAWTAAVTTTAGNPLSEIDPV